MDWLSNTIIQEPFSVVIPVIIIISIFAYIARRAHVKHIERMKEINKRYTQHVISKFDG